MDWLLCVVSECGIDIQDTGVVLPLVIEFVCSKGHVCNSITNHFGAMSEDIGN